MTSTDSTPDNKETLVYEGCSSPANNLNDYASLNVKHNNDDIFSTYCIDARPHAFERILLFLFWIKYLLFLPITLFVYRFTVKHHERAIFIRFGRVILDTDGKPKIFQPGVYMCLPCIDEGKVITLRPTNTCISSENAFSKDSIRIVSHADSVTRVIDPKRRILLKDGMTDDQIMWKESKHLKRLVQKFKVGEGIKYKTEIEEHLLAELKKELAVYGKTVDWVGVTQLEPMKKRFTELLAGPTLTSLQSRVEEIVKTKGELEALNELKTAAKILEDSGPAGMHLRRMQALREASQSSTTKTHLIPLPTDVLTSLASKMT